MAARRRGRRRGQGRSTIAGLLVLVLAGVGVWFAAEWVEGDGIDVFRTLEPGDSDTALPTERAPDGVRVRVEILNAGGVAGMASTARDELRDLGWDVVYYGNAATFDADSSAVVHRGGNPDWARGVGRALGIEHFDSDPDPTGLVDVTVRLGASWLSRDERTPGPDPSGS